MKRDVKAKQRVQKVQRAQQQQALPERKRGRSAPTGTVMFRELKEEEIVPQYYVLLEGSKKEDGENEVRQQQPRLLALLRTLPLPLLRAMPLPLLRPLVALPLRRTLRSSHCRPAPRKCWWRRTSSWRPARTVSWSTSCGTGMLHQSNHARSIVRSVCVR